MRQLDNNNDAFDNNDEEEEIIWVSKSELKRDAQALKKLGTELLALSPSQLNEIPLNDNLLAAIELARKLKREGLRRQIQLIGKLLRLNDPEPVLQALDKIKNKHHHQMALFHKIEQWRDKLITGGDATFSQFLAHYPTVDHQQLRTLIRAATKERALNKPAKNTRQLFQYIKECMIPE